MSAELIARLPERLLAAAKILKKHPCEVLWLERDCRLAAEALSTRPAEGDVERLLTEGWRIVPANITPDMAKAASAYFASAPEYPTYAGIYTAMLGAAPLPPALSAKPEGR